MAPFHPQQSPSVDQDLDVSSPTATSLVYRPLDSTKNEIRLLRIEPSSDISSVIIGTLYYVPIDHRPSYEALSYTWADSRDNDAEYDSDNEEDHYISLDDHCFPVGRNLFAALRQLRLPSAERLFWVDAICINQSDLVERSEQVSIMKAIYVGARRVVSWIGEVYGNSRAAFKILHTLPQYGSMEKWYQVEYGVGDNHSADPEATAIIEAVLHLFRRRYWSRVWVLQELAFAKDITIACGPDSISWTTLQTNCTIFKASEYFIDSKFGGTHIGHHIFDLRKAGPNTMERFGHADNHELLTLGTLLAKHRHQFATDPRDKVYSLLGMASEVTPQNSLAVDYRLATHEIYRSTALFLLQTESTLSFLGENKPALSPNPSKPQLPTWVPDWTNANNTMSPAVATNGAFSASGILTAAETIINDTHNTISVRGIPITTIANVGVNLSGLDPDVINFLPVFSLMYEWWKLYLSTGRTAICGPGSFVDIVNYGMWYRAFPPSQVSYATELFLKSFAICLKKYEHEFPPLDRHLNDLIATQDGVLEDGFVLRRAESELWDSTPRCRDRRFFVGAEAEIGLGPLGMRERDVVVVVAGCEVPVVLRRVQEDVGGEGGGGGNEIGEKWVNLGDTYVDGFMAGEAVVGLERGRYKMKFFEIC
jgi:Heterokaryon incompatibility protein (HET)